MSFLAWIVLGLIEGPSRIAPRLEVTPWHARPV
jgi:hypothetical protein